MARLSARLLPLLAALVLGLFSVAIRPATAFACSCRGLSTTTAADRADAIFQGEVVAKKTVRRPKPGRTEMRFLVSRVYKGEVYAEQVVASPLGSAGCGLDPQLHSTWVIFATDEIEGRGDEAVFRSVTGLCSGNLPTSAPPAVLGRGHAPLSGASDREERAVSTDAAVTRGLVIAGFVAAGLAVIFVAGLAVLWRNGRPPS